VKAEATVKAEGTRGNDLGNEHGRKRKETRLHRPFPREEALACKASLRCHVDFALTAERWPE